MGLSRITYIVVLSLACALVSCNNKSKMKTMGTEEKPERIHVLKEDAPEGLPCRVIEAELVGDLVKVKFGNKKACENNSILDYHLFTKLQINKTNPPQLRIFLNNFNAQNDANCDQVFVETKYFDLKPLKKAFKSNDMDYKQVILNIDGKTYGTYQLNE